MLRLKPELYGQFLNNFVKGIAKPHLMHRYIIFCMNMYIHQISKVYNREYKQII